MKENPNNTQTTNGSNFHLRGLLRDYQSLSFLFSCDRVKVFGTLHHFLGKGGHTPLFWPSEGRHAERIAPALVHPHPKLCLRVQVKVRLSPNPPVRLHHGPPLIPTGDASVIASRIPLLSLLNSRKDPASASACGDVPDGRHVPPCVCMWGTPAFCSFSGLFSQPSLQ